jgi:hypothetical protein
VLHWLDQAFPRILREARQRDAHLVFLDESGFMLSPVVRRTLWPRGVCQGTRTITRLLDTNRYEHNR